MDIVNFDGLKAQGKILSPADVNPDEDYFIIGKYSNYYSTDNFKATKYPIWAIKAGDVIGVQSVTGLNTDNTDPYNPIVKISVDGVTITGEGTPASPLVASVPLPAYKVYTALLTQTGGSAPVATVLENTLGDNIIWTRDSNGSYLGTLSGMSGLFASGKTFLLITPNSEVTDTPFFTMVRFDINKIYVYTYDDHTGNYTDSLLLSTPIEIRVYN